MRNTLIKELASDSKEAFFLWKQSLRLSIAILIADLKQRAYNRRYWVLPDPKDRLIALCNRDIKRLKKLKIMDRKVDFIHLLSESFYYTPLDRNNKKSALSEQEKAQKRLSWILYSQKLYRKSWKRRSN